MRYLKTLRRIPKAIILDMGAREFNMETSASCVCGWAVRDSLDIAINGESTFTADEKLRIAEPHHATSWYSKTNEIAQRQFGGTQREWNAIFYAAAGMDPDRQCTEVPVTEHLEEAFTRRVMECCR